MKLDTSFVNGWHKTSMASHHLFSLEIFRIIIVGIDYDNSEMYPTLYVVLFNFGIQIEFWRY